jgi:hypothetical protein
VNLPPELALLLHCAEANPTQEKLRIIAHLASAGLDWERITQASCAHGVAPLIYSNLRRSGAAETLPSAAVEALSRSYYANAARNALLYNELCGVLQTFRKKGIDAIALKGIILADTVYRDRALRPMSDIDLLVKREKLEDAEASLIEMGYTLGAHSMAKELRLERDYHLLYTKGAGLNIEVHWHITRPTAPLRISIDDLWARAEPVLLAGAQTLSLSLEDLLLHLCQHMHKHDLIGGIRPLCDIAHVVEHYGNAVDWMELRTRSSQWGISPYVYLALCLAKELLDARVPSAFLKGFEPAGFDRAVIEWAKERLIDCQSSSISHNVVQLCWNGHRFSDRLTAVRNAFAPEVVAQHYRLSHDSYRLALYYPLRLKYLVTRYGPLIWQLIIGDDQLRLTKWLSSVVQ